VAVALKLDADHPAALGEPRQDVAEAAAECDDAAVQGHERRSCGVAVLLVPDGDAVDLLVGHAFPTIEAVRTHRPGCDRAPDRGGSEVVELRGPRPGTGVRQDVAV
jgi:hypothetical protein